MKRILTAFVLSVVLGIGLVYAETSDIDQVEVLPDVAVWRLDTVRFLVFTKTCEVTYRKGYLDGSDFVTISGANEAKIIFQNVEDNPETVEDETLTEFTDLVIAINNGSNIKNTIAQAVRIKLGL